MYRPTTHGVLGGISFTFISTSSRTLCSRKFRTYPTLLGQPHSPLHTHKCSSLNTQSTPPDTPINTTELCSTHTELLWLPTHLKQVVTNQHSPHLQIHRAIQLSYTHSHGSPLHTHTHTHTTTAPQNPLKYCQHSRSEHPPTPAQLQGRFHSPYKASCPIHQLATALRLNTPHTHTYTHTYLRTYAHAHTPQSTCGPDIGRSSQRQARTSQCRSSCLQGQGRATCSRAG